MVAYGNFGDDRVSKPATQTLPETLPKQFGTCRTRAGFHLGVSSGARGSKRDLVLLTSKLAADNGSYASMTALLSAIQRCLLRTFTLCGRSGTQLWTISCASYLYLSRLLGSCTYIVLPSSYLNSCSHFRRSSPCFRHNATLRKDGKRRHDCAPTRFQ